MIEISKKGHWYIDSDEENKVPGLLTFSQEGKGTLDLFAELNGATRPTETPEDITVIHGRLIDGPKVKLIDCTRTGGRGGTTTIERQSFSYSSGVYSVDTILISEYDPEAPIKKVEVEFPALERWFNQNIFQYIGEGDGRSGGFKYSIPGPISIEFEDYRISLQIAVQESVSPSSSVEMSQQASFSMTLEDPTNDLGEIKDIVRKISDLISFAVGDAVAPSKVMIAPPNGEPGAFNSGELYYSVRGAQSSEEFNIHSKNFDLTDISEDIRSIFKSWMSGYERLGPLFNLYFSVIRNDSMIVENQFLNLAQSIEVYHRRTFGGQYISDDQFEEFREDLEEIIPDEFPNDFKMSLKRGTFKYANEYSLRKRLKDLVSEYESLLSHHTKHNENIVAQIVDTRNYHTHYDEESKPPHVHEHEEISSLLEYEKYMIEIILLDEIGFGEREIESALMDSDH